jgi:hypothetical protein
MVASEFVRGAGLDPSPAEQSVSLLNGFLNAFSNLGEFDQTHFAIKISVRAYRGPNCLYRRSKSKQIPSGCFAK